MRDFFKEYKKYIIKHPKKVEYKPTSNNFDIKELCKVVEKVNTDIPYTEEDQTAIEYFITMSDNLHNLCVEFYKYIEDNYKHLNLKGCHIAEYIIAWINREYKVVWDKRKVALEKAGKGIFLLSDLTNFKLPSIDPKVGLLDARACLESMTDSCSLLLNHLRYFLNKELSYKDSKPEEFSDRIINLIQNSQMLIALKYSYDDILYNDGFVNIDEKNRLITFDYENKNNLKLLLAGNMMFTERQTYVMRRASEEGINPRLFKYTSNYRIKNVIINNSSITLDFGKGYPKEYKLIVSVIQSYIDAYYEFLVGSTILPKLNNCTIDEAISVWCAIQYIVEYVLLNVNYNVSIIYQKDFSSVPSKILKKDLISYIEKLTNIKRSKIKAVITILEADWTKFNDIWTSMLYPVEEYYLLPFYPITCSSPYNVIDKIMFKGGFNLDDRGIQFEKFLHNQLTQKETPYPITCIPTGKYGKKGSEEEIDILISMKNVVLVAEAKCIHYSIEPLNYAEAWERLEEGCEQAIRKAEFIKNNPQYFNKLGDYSSKEIIPFVVTNYPTFSGFSHKGVYVIDSYSFLAYIHSGTMTIRQLTSTIDPILGIKFFYHNEDEFSNKFIEYLSNNPIKQILLKQIYIHDLPITTGNNGWNTVSKSAQVNNDPIFNIPNDI